jgi:anti-sigma B factor antagonist
LTLTNAVELTVDTSQAPLSIVSVAGEIDAIGAPVLQAQLDEMTRSGVTDVVLDISAVSFIDSTGIGTLVRYHRSLQAIGGDLRVAVTQPYIRRLFEMTGITDVLSVYESVQMASRTPTE